jgi:hypothetical protein
MLITDKKFASFRLFKTQENRKVFKFLVGFLSLCRIIVTEEGNRGSGSSIFLDTTL